MPNTGAQALGGVGLGLRRALLAEFSALEYGQVDFLEAAPENWIGVGGRFGRQYAALAERFPMALHGLSLDIGGPDPLDRDLIAAIADHIQRYNCVLYSEHLTYCASEGHLYDLLPIPFTEEAVHYVAARIRQVQDMIGQPLVLENASYYAQPHKQLSEAEFVDAVLAESGANLLLDVNNLYVNSINHNYKPEDYLDALPLEKVVYLHIAGHYDEAEDLKVDTHGAAVIEPVWTLLAEVYRRVGRKPTLLERDFNFPPMSELLAEVERIRQIQAAVDVSGVSRQVPV